MALDRFAQTTRPERGRVKRRVSAVGWASRAFGRSGTEVLALPEF
jgi:hypothetical protein